MQITSMTGLLEAADFAARAHVQQRRKGAAQEPYVNHLLEVAWLLASCGEGDDLVLLQAALLHDTVEDTEVTPEQLTARFGAEVTAVVLEVTDDKMLPKMERKRLQVETAADKSRRARLLKIADKISNLRALKSTPPQHWEPERRRAYHLWAAQVVDRCRGLNPRLEEIFDQELEQGLVAFRE